VAVCVLSDAGSCSHQDSTKTEGDHLTCLIILLMHNPASTVATP
jgi:hypothetical protein